MADMPFLDWWDVRWPDLIRMVLAWAVRRPAPGIVWAGGDLHVCRT